jgi:hypothetical protein
MRKAVRRARHFERVHTLVLSRKAECLSCHADMAPYKMETHKADRDLRLTVCQSCHVSPPLQFRRTAAEE